MSGRFSTRARLLLRAVARRAAAGRRVAPAAPRSILILPTLLSGDALFLAPLMAKLRLRFPAAAIRVAAARSVVPLFSGRPYGVEAIVHAPGDPANVRTLTDLEPPDLAFIVGDNRFSIVAAALGARWIVAFSGDKPAYKNWYVDEFRPMATAPMVWGEMAASLADGEQPAPFSVEDWPAPSCVPFDAPTGRYALLHVEASTPLKHWEKEKWLALAEMIAKEGIEPVWSAGPGGSALLASIDPAARFRLLGHQLDLAQLWHLVARAALLVCPDTSVMHIGRLAGTPTVALFGPSSASLFGPGEFWRNVPYRAVTVEHFPCRDQHRLFKREIAWIQRCQRTPAECAAPRCMHAIGVEAVARAALEIAR